MWHDRQPADYLEPFNLLHRNQMMENEPPDHTRLRRPVAQAFARGHVERLRPRVRELAASLLDEADPTVRPDPRLRRAAAGAGHRRAARGAASDAPTTCATGRRRSCGCTSPSRRRRWSPLLWRPAPTSPVSSASWSVARRAAPADDLISDLRRDRADRGRDRRLGRAAAQRRPRGLGQRLRQRRGRHAAAVGCDPRPTCRLTVEEMLRFDSALQLFERTATGGRRGRRCHGRGGGEDRGAARLGQPGSGGLRVAGRVPGGPVERIRTWRSASACTSAWVLRWPGWSSPSRSRPCGNDGPT